MKKSLIGARIGIVLELIAGMIMLGFASSGKPVPDFTMWIFVFGLIVSVVCSVLTFFEKEN